MAGNSKKKAKRSILKKNSSARSSDEPTQAHDGALAPLATIYPSLLIKLTTTPSPQPAFRQPESALESATATPPPDNLSRHITFFTDTLSADKIMPQAITRDKRHLRRHKKDTSEPQTLMQKLFSHETKPKVEKRSHAPDVK
jgi:hypothetical protein